MLDLIFVKVESSMQRLDEIYGHLFEQVKRTYVHGTERL